MAQAWNWDSPAIARRASRMFEAPEVEKSSVGARALRDGGLSTGADRPTRYRATVIRDGERVEVDVIPPRGQVLGDFDAYGGASGTERAMANRRRLAERIRASGLVDADASDLECVRAELVEVKRTRTVRAPEDRRAFAIKDRIRRFTAKHGHAPDAAMVARWVKAAVA